MSLRPTLLSSCASATTAKEAAFRIDAPPGAPRAARVVTLDAGADDLVRPLFADRWPGARFLRYEPPSGPALGGLDDIELRANDGNRSRLDDELADADFVMMVATAADGAAGASAIGLACTMRGIMTAGLILGEDAAAGPAVSALRPHARVLLVSRDPADVGEILRAVGA